MGQDEARMLSDNFSARELLCVGETYSACRVRNIPQQPETWEALEALCALILEPVRSEFGHPIITYGFASLQLSNLIPGRIAPHLDQHAGHELRADGEPVCKRLGQAADFFVSGVRSRALAEWIVNSTPFDRLYYYGADRPIHVSVGPQQSRSIVAMLPNTAGRRLPRRMSAGQLSVLSEARADLITRKPTN